MKTKRRFTVVEYSSFYAVRDNESGEEAHMGDGVDTLFCMNNKAMKCGTEHFRKTWEDALNRDADETQMAYFN